MRQSRFWLSSLLAYSPRGVLAKRLVGPAFVIISLATIGIVAYKGWKETPNVSLTINYPLLVLSFVVYSLALALAVIGWYLIVDRIVGSQGFRSDTRIYVLSNVAKRLPGGIWGIAGRVYMYKRNGHPESLVLMATMVETLVMSASVLILLPLFNGFGQLARNGFGWMLWLLVIILVMSLLNPWSLNVLRRFIARRLAEHDVEMGKEVGLGALLIWLAVYAMVWVLGGMLVFCLVSSIYPVPLELGHVTGIIGSWVAAGTMSMLIYFLPGGFGVTELTLTAMLSFYVPTPIAAISAIGVRLFITASEMLWAFIVMKWG